MHSRDLGLFSFHHAVSGGVFVSETEQVGVFSFITKILICCSYFQQHTPKKKKKKRENIYIEIDGKFICQSP